MWFRGVVKRIMEDERCVFCIQQTGIWENHWKGEAGWRNKAGFFSDFTQIAKEEQADLVIVAGDVYDSYNPPAEAEKLFYRTLKEITEGGKRLVLVIAGNHDSPDRLSAAGPLAMEHGILMAGLPGSVIPAGTYGCHQVIDSGEGYVEIEINGERAVILLLPYPSEKRLNDVIYQEMDEEEKRASSYGERIGRFFSALEGIYREDTINLAVAIYLPWTRLQADRNGESAWADPMW